MDINSWLTIITVFIAVLAFFPKEERKILGYKLGKFEYWAFVITLVAIIPYLILFPKISGRISFLKIFIIKDGFESENTAFGVFYIVFMWIVIRLFWFRPKKRINAKTIEFYFCCPR